MFSAFRASASQFTMMTSSKMTTKIAMNKIASSNTLQHTPVTLPSIGITQMRWSTRGRHRGLNRGNTYQPNTLKRKRRLGFLARMRSLSGRKIVKDRKKKGRWFLSY